MRKYFTWRCIGLHALVLFLVPGFLVAGWWQYHVARSGNALGWVYAVEWPSLAGYAIYAWWRLIHDRSTPFDRLWAAKQRVIADEWGTPIYQIPGWARNKELSRAVEQASIGRGGAPALAPTTARALESGDANTHSAAEDGLQLAGQDGRTVAHRDDAVVDARVIAVRVTVDEELDAYNAYNAYLFDLNWRDPPKRWAPARRRSRPFETAPQRELSNMSDGPEEKGGPELTTGWSADGGS
ncbi:MAG: hypothetical protein ACRDZ6_01840 [Acidimicrobiales bacterium]